MKTGKLLRKLLLRSRVEYGKCFICVYLNHIWFVWYFLLGALCCVGERTVLEGVRTVTVAKGWSARTWRGHAENKCASWWGSLILNPLALEHKSAANNASFIGTEHIRCLAHLEGNRRFEYVQLVHEGVNHFIIRFHFIHLNYYEIWLIVNIFPEMWISSQNFKVA